MKIAVTAKTIRLDYGQMHALHNAAVGMVENPADPEGPIDAKVPWYAASLFVKAVALATGETPQCDYVRPGYGHLVSPGRRACREANEAVQAVRLQAEFPHVWSDGRRCRYPEPTTPGDTDFLMN
jgi:hypothetical protein